MARGRGSLHDYMQIVALTLFLSSGVFAVVALVTHIRQARGWEKVEVIEQRHGELTKLLKQRDLRELIQRVEERESSDKKGESMQEAVNGTAREIWGERWLDRGMEDKEKRYIVTLLPATLDRIIRFLDVLYLERPDIYCVQFTLNPVRTSRSPIGGAAAVDEGSKQWIARLTFGSFASAGP